MTQTHNLSARHSTMDKGTVAVVGGGIAGLYAAWQLQTDYTVTVFEATERLGGRILSQPIPGVAGPAELGAMRFREDHRVLHRLLEALHLQPQTALRDFAFDDRFYLRGHYATSAADLVEHYVLYGPEKALQPLSPARLIIHAFRQLFANNAPVREAFQHFLTASHADKRTALARFHTAYEQHCKYAQCILEVQGMPEENRTTQLHNVGFWNIMSLLLSNEAFHLAQDGLGYESIFSNWNAAEAILWFVYDYIDNQYQTLTGGLGTLTDTLAGQLTTTVDLRYQHRLAAIEVGPRALPPHTAPLLLHFTNGAVYRCDRVLLALPRSALETLTVTGSAGWQAFRQVSGAVLGQRAFKCFLVYAPQAQAPAEWWAHDSPFGADGMPNASASCFRICTDLPLRQVYYFGADWLKRYASTGSEAQADGAALVMASYSDDRHTTFWWPLVQSQHGYDPQAQEPYNTRDDFPTEHEFQRLQPFVASRRMVNYIVAQLLKLHDCFDHQGQVKQEKQHLAAIISHPAYAVYKMWDPEAGEAAWHYWDVRWKREEVEATIDRLAAYDGIGICGEAYSNNPGWIEGALQATERVLEQTGFTLKSSGTA